MAIKLPYRGGRTTESQIAAIQKNQQFIERMLNRIPQQEFSYRRGSSTVAAAAGLPFEVYSGFNVVNSDDWNQAEIIPENFTGIYGLCDYQASIYCIPIGGVAMDVTNTQPRVQWLYEAESLRKQDSFYILANQGEAANQQIFFRWLCIVPGIIPWVGFGIDRVDLGCLYRFIKGGGLQSNEYNSNFPTKQFPTVGTDAQPGYLWDDGPHWYHAQCGSSGTTPIWNEEQGNDPDCTAHPLPPSGVDFTDTLGAGPGGTIGITDQNDRERCTGTFANGFLSSDEWTIKVCCKVDTSAGRQKVFSKGITSAVGRNWYFDFVDGKPAVGFEDSGGTQHEAQGTALTNGEWHVFVGRRSGPTIELWVDDPTTTVASTSSAAVADEGRGHHFGRWSGSDGYTGTIGWGQMHKRAQTDAEIAADVATIKSEMAKRAIVIT